MNAQLSFRFPRKVAQLCCVALLIAVCGLSVFTYQAFASTPDPGGDATVVSPSDESPVSVTEDAVQPESANIRLIVPTLSDPAGGTPSSIRIISVTGGTLWQGNGSSITLGASGTAIGLSSGKVDLRFRPDAGWDVDASFEYSVVDPHDSAVNSTASTATVSITAVNDEPVLQTLSGSTGIGLAATYYLDSWELTGSTFRRIDATVNFNNNFGVSGMNNENFSVRWSGQVKSPIDGAVTFSTVSDDGVRLWVDDVLIVDNWTLHGPTTDTASPVTLEADEMYDIRMEFYERGGGEVAQLQWAYSGQSTQIIPQTYLFPAITRPTLSYVVGSASVVIDDAIAVSDVDSSELAGATVEISSNFQSDEDSLLFTNQNGITGSYDSGTLTLSGSASVANYQTALRSVRYANSSLDPDTSTRTIEFTVNDGEDDSNATYRNIEFTGSNTAPVITEGASTSVTMDEDGSPTAFSLTLNATDADFHSISWSVSGEASNGTAVADGSGDSQAISYTPDENYSGSDSFTVQASDGAGGTDTITVNVTVDPRNDAPYALVDPSISGTGYVGDVLTVGPGSWSDDDDTTPGDISFAYQWQSADTEDGTGLEDIDGATASSYTPDQVGTYIRAKVTATDDGEGSPESQSTVAYTLFTQIIARPVVNSTTRSSSSGSVDIIDPVKSATVSGRDINRDPQTVEVVSAEHFTFRVKAADADQVKSAVITVAGKTYVLKLDRTDSSNPVFVTSLILNSTGTYPYTVTIDYGFTTRNRKGTFVAKEKPSIGPGPMPVVALVSEPRSLTFSQPLERNLVITEAVLENDFDAPGVDESIAESPSPQPVVKASPQIENQTESPRESGRVLSFVKGVLRTTGRSVASGWTRVTSGISVTVSNTAKAITSTASAMSARVAAVTLPFPAKSDHMYERVTIRLASADGTPLSGASVTLFSTPKTAVADADGTVEFERVESGKHKLHVEYQGYTTKQSLMLDQQVAEVTINITAEFNKKGRFTWPW